MVKHPVLTVLASTLLIMWQSHGVAKDYYRWTDAQGVSHYSDKPPSDAVEVERVNTEKKAEPVLLADQEKSDAAKNTDNPSANGQTPQTTHVNSARCQDEKTRLELLTNNANIQMQHADGTVHTLSEDEIQTEKRRSEQAIKRYCL